MKSLQASIQGTAVTLLTNFLIFQYFGVRSQKYFFPFFLNLLTGRRSEDKTKLTRQNYEITKITKLQDETETSVTLQYLQFSVMHFSILDLGSQQTNDEDCCHLNQIKG